MRDMKLVHARFKLAHVVVGVAREDLDLHGDWQGAHEADALKMFGTAEKILLCGAITCAIGLLYFTSALRVTRPRARPHPAMDGRGREAV